MIEDKSIRCDECGQIVGMLTKNAQGSREETVGGNDANCDYPPVVTCPDARLAFCFFLVRVRLSGFGP